MKKARRVNAELQKGPLMHIQMKRANGRVTIRIQIGDMTITLDLPL
jgi:hypothetical protein